MKKTLLFFGFLLLFLPMKAQDYQDYINQKKQEMEHYKNSTRQSYDDYRRKANEEYAQFMRQHWEEFQAVKGEDRPSIPEPPKPLELGNNEPIPELPKLIPVKPIPTPDPSPLKPITKPTIPVIPTVPSIPEFKFTCYGTDCIVRLSNKMKFKLKENTENSVADAWVQLSAEESSLLLQDCFDLREELALGDWAYYCLLRDLSDAFLGKGTEEATLMQTYLLAQSGYKVRIGKKNGHLVLLLPFDDMVYETSYITMGGQNYFVMGRRESGGTQVFNRSFSDNESLMSLRMPCPPKFSYSPTKNKSFTSKRYPELTIDLNTNQNLLDFYTGYPVCLWTNYSWTGLTEEIKAKLYPMLRKGIAGKSQIEAANRIINFVQTALAYKTDDEQFGYERTLFGDETFYYPYSDCEDRAILFSILVRDLLGLDVALLNYHDHLATAVCYTEELNGYYLMLDGKKYYISDPTYIGANVGMCAPNYINESPEIFKL